MGLPQPRIVFFRNNRGLPGTVVGAAITGTGFEMVTEIRFSGSGVTASVVLLPSADTIDLTISVAADALPGPRVVELHTAGGLIASEGAQAFFYVLGPAGYASASGIGTHLL
jgi:hypothetical protein